MIIQIYHLQAKLKKTPLSINLNSNLQNKKQA